MKHEHYKHRYLPDDYFWGLGIENETYLQFSKPKTVDRSFVMTHHKWERYSVDYYANYRPGVFKAAMGALIGSESRSHSQRLSLPILMNGHGLDKTDCYNQPKRMYTVANEPNPRFSGQTVLDMLKARDPDYFVDGYGKEYIFDGDTIEFATTAFYKTTIEDVIEDLVRMKEAFITRVRGLFSERGIFSQYGEIDFARRNHGMAVFTTNLNNLAIFNNMTYHFNITLPTQLDSRARVANSADFIRRHKNAIRVLQWVSPLLIAKYGAPEVLPGLFTKASQRCALSRYIGIGTYDTNTMPTGKMLSAPFEENAYHDMADWWYHSYYRDCQYKRCPEVGFDFNFNKHLNHGLELRIMDYFPENQLYDFMRMLVYLMDHSLSKPEFPNPVEDPIWNRAVDAVIREGPDTRFSQDMMRRLWELFNIRQSDTNVISIFDGLLFQLCRRYHDIGECSLKMIATHEKSAVCCALV